MRSIWLLNRGGNISPGRWLSAIAVADTHEQAAETVSWRAPYLARIVGTASEDYPVPECLASED